MPLPTKFVVVLLALLVSEQVSGTCFNYTINSPGIDVPHKNAPNVFRIGAFASFLDPVCVSLMRFACYLLNQRTDILPDVLLEFHWAELNHLDANALLASQVLVNDYDVRALIGGIYTSENTIGQLVSRVYNVPQVASTPISSLLSDKLEYPSLVRPIPPDSIQAAAIAQVIGKYNWKQIMVIYSDDDYGSYGVTNLGDEVKALNVTLFSYQVSQSATNFTGYIPNIAAIMTQHNLRVVVMYTKATPAMAILGLLNKIGLITEEYVYIMTYINQLFSIANYHTNFPYAIGMIGPSPRGVVPSDVATEIYNAWMTSNSSIFPGSRPPSTVYWYFLESVYLIANGLDAILKSGQAYNSINGSTLLAAMRAVNYTGITGDVYLDVNGDRVGDYFWYSNAPNSSSATVPIAMYSGTSLTTNYFSNFTFFDGNMFPTDGICHCVRGTCNAQGACACDPNYSGVLCEIYTPAPNSFGTLAISLVVVLPTIFIVGILLGALNFIRYKRRMIIKDVSERQRSVIKREDINLLERIGRGASGEVFKGILRGTEVAVKRLLATNTSKEAIQEFDLECAIMAGLRHPNIVMFMGNCFVADTKEMLLVMELMAKGSLFDVIHNPKIHISHELSLNIAYQAAKGMNFLHQSSPPIIHRDLKSHNILMDDKWNARISDFGITIFKDIDAKSSKTPKESDHKAVGTIYWTAPEIFEGKSHTEASDCYSFGIVLWEIFTRKIPYNGKEPMLVAMGVTNNLRPELSDSIPYEIRDLITSCWSKSPAKRPTFEQIMEQLRMQLSPAANTSGGGSTSMGAGREGNYMTEPPTGSVFFVNTDVENASDLWEELPMEMLHAIELHNTALRANLQRYGGYEVDFSNNGFFMCFGNIKSAMNWCISSQLALLNVAWPDAVLSHPHCGEVTVGGALIWNGLRVRMVIHTGVPNCVLDRSTERMTYMGPVVDQTRKLLHSTRHQNTILISAAVLDYINTKAQGVQFVEEVSYENCGDLTESFRAQTAVYKVLPKPLFNRNALSNLRSSQGGSELPHSVILVTSLSTDKDMALAAGEGKTSRKHPSSVIPYVAIEEKETVGKGPIGDFHRCIYKGQQYTLKVLINQKLEEADILSLQARSAVLSKLKHPNLLEFYGVCLDVGHAGLVISYLPNSGLPALLADSSTSLDFRTKVRIAKQIAEGMNYLANSEHKFLTTHATLKSSNVLVIRERMEVKLCDFGQGNLKDLARTMTSVGTVAWTAPELLSGEGEATPKISVYAFGIILWELYSRKMPYSDQHPIRVVGKIITGFRPTTPSDCPPLYSQLMEQCWDGAPSQRPSWTQILTTLNNM